MSSRRVFLMMLSRLTSENSCRAARRAASPMVSFGAGGFIVRRSEIFPRIVECQLKVFEMKSRSRSLSCVRALSKSAAGVLSFRREM